MSIIRSGLTRNIVQENIDWSIFPSLRDEHLNSPLTWDDLMAKDSSIEFIADIFIDRKFRQYFVRYLVWLFADELFPEQDTETQSEAELTACLDARSRAILEAYEESASAAPVEELVDIVFRYFLDRNFCDADRKKVCGTPARDKFWDRSNLKNKMFGNTLTKGPFFTFALALNMSYTDAETFLRKVLNGQSFNLFDPEELLIAFALEYGGESKWDYFLYLQDLWNQVPECGRNRAVVEPPAEPFSTRLIRREVTTLGDLLEEYAQADLPNKTNQEALYLSFFQKYQDIMLRRGDYRRSIVNSFLDLYNEVSTILDDEMTDFYSNLDTERRRSSLLNYLYSPDSLDVVVRDEDDLVQKVLFSPAEYEMLNKVLKDTRITDANVSNALNGKLEYISREKLLTLIFVKRVADSDSVDQFLEDQELLRQARGNAETDELAVSRFLLRELHKDITVLFSQLDLQPLYLANSFDCLLVYLLGTDEPLASFRNLWARYLVNKDYYEQKNKAK